MQTPLSERKSHAGIRLVDEGDVVSRDPSHRPLLSAADLTPLSTRSSRLRDFLDNAWPCSRRSTSGRIHLPPTPEGERIDPFDELDSSVSCYKSRRRRYIIIGCAVAVWLLAIVAYVVDVERSWRALEDKWAVSTDNL